MSRKCNNQGRAYEFAWINALADALAPERNVVVTKNSSYEANRRAWDSLAPDKQELYRISASAAIPTVLELEPRMVENSGDTLTLTPQKDGSGITGDVRDMVIRRGAINWEIGLSIKHNHEAVKHCRLSHRLDFGKEWFDRPCSPQYWSDIKPVFDMLKSERRKGTKFSQLPDKEHDVYLPLLNAFINEVNRQYAAAPETARKMIEYLIGVTDYYKIISHDAKRLTVIRTFNVNGMLGHPAAAKISAITVPVLSLPTRLIALQRKPGSNTTAEMYLDNGWQLSFRIHNAEDKIAPTLKFDIQFVGIPPEVLSIECRWDTKGS